MFSRHWPDQLVAVWLSTEIQGLKHEPPRGYRLFFWAHSTTYMLSCPPTCQRLEIYLLIKRERAGQYVSEYTKCAERRLVQAGLQQVSLADPSAPYREAPNTHTL